MWLLGFLCAVIAVVLSFAHANGGSWFVVGLTLVTVSFVQPWVAAKRFSRETLFGVPLLLLLIGAVIGLWASYDAKLSLSPLLALAASIALFFAIVNSPRQQVLSKIAVLIGAIVAIYYLVQYRHIGQADKSTLASAIGTAISGSFPDVGLWEPFPNSVATMLEGLIPLGIALIVARGSHVWRAVSAGATLLMGLAVLVTASRGAWVALGVAGAFWLASRWRWALVAGFVTVIVGVLVLAVYLASVGPLGATLAGIPVIGSVLDDLFVRPDRLDVYRGSLRLIQDFPLTGVGLGDVFGLVYSQYVLLIPYVFLTYSHNLYLSVWLGHGLLGMIGLAWVVGALGVLVVREHRATVPSPLFQASWTGILSVLVHGLFDARQYVDLWTMWPLFALLGLLTRAGTTLTQDRYGASSLATSARRWRWVVLVLAAAGGAALWRPVAAVSYANLGAIMQARATLAPRLSDGAKQVCLEAAYRDYERALALEPRNRTANLRLGELKVAEGRYEEGIVHLETVWQAAPKDPTVRKALGLAYAWVGEVDRAALLLDGTQDIVSELNTWGWWYGQEGRQQVAINAYRTSLALEPDQPQVQEWISALESH